MKQNCKRIFSLLLCAALVCTLFAGCGGRNKQLDIIYPITGNITSFDPQVAATQDEYLIAENCYEGLVRVEDDGTVKPAVAADWTVSTDQKTYLNRYNAAIKFLTLVAEGTVSIGTETEDPASAAAGGFKVKSNSRLFTREKMRGM